MNVQKSPGKMVYPKGMWHVFLHWTLFSRLCQSTYIKYKLDTHIVLSSRAAGHRKSERRPERPLGALPRRKH